MNTDKLRVVFEKSNDKYADSKAIGTTYQTMYNIIYRKSICKVDLIEKIANFYKVPVGYFFDEENVDINQQSHHNGLSEVIVAEYSKRCQDLLNRMQEQISTKEKQINTLIETNQKLTDKLINN